MCVSAQFPVVVRYSTSFSMMGPSPMMELALGLIHRYVAPTASSSGGAMGVGGSVDNKKSWKHETNVAKGENFHLQEYRNLKATMV